MTSSQKKDVKGLDEGGGGGGGGTTAAAAAVAPASAASSSASAANVVYVWETRYFPPQCRHECPELYEKLVHTVRFPKGKKFKTPVARANLIIDTVNYCRRTWEAQKTADFDVREYIRNKHHLFLNNLFPEQMYPFLSLREIERFLVVLSRHQKLERGGNGPVRPASGLILQPTLLKKVFFQRVFEDDAMCSSCKRTITAHPGTPVPLNSGYGRCSSYPCLSHVLDDFIYPSYGGFHSGRSYEYPSKLLTCHYVFYLMLFYHNGRVKVLGYRQGQSYRQLYVVGLYELPTEWTFTPENGNRPKFVDQSKVTRESIEQFAQQAMCFRDIPNEWSKHMRVILWTENTFPRMTFRKEGLTKDHNLDLLGYDEKICRDNEMKAEREFIKAVPTEDMKKWLGHRYFDAPASSKEKMILTPSAAASAASSSSSSSAAASAAASAPVTDMEIHNSIIRDPNAIEWNRTTQTPKWPLRVSGFTLADMPCSVKGVLSECVIASLGRLKADPNIVVHIHDPRAPGYWRIYDHDETDGIVRVIGYKAGFGPDFSLNRKPSYSLIEKSYFDLRYFEEYQSVFLIPNNNPRATVSAASGRIADVVIDSDDDDGRNQTQEEGGGNARPAPSTATAASAARPPSPSYSPTSPPYSPISLSASAASASVAARPPSPSYSPSSPTNIPFAAPAAPAPTPVPVPVPVTKKPKPKRKELTSEEREILEKEEESWTSNKKSRYAGGGGGGGASSSASASAGRPATALPPATYQPASASAAAASSSSSSSSSAAQRSLRLCAMCRVPLPYGGVCSVDGLMYYCSVCAVDEFDS